ncbi:hypothetical protein yaldo0001_27900 [Yersinia aldovae ATCC 35236]|nr:hypothetical protein yaldo0001_27900 [Yersinia aldovae ATCC 35236]
MFKINILSPPPPSPSFPSQPSISAESIRRIIVDVMEM